LNINKNGKGQLKRVTKEKKRGRVTRRVTKKLDVMDNSCTVYRFRYRIIRNRKCNIRRIEIREIVSGLEDRGVECPALQTVN
jgi:hypothetical protein